MAKAKFAALEKFDLPFGQFAITGSGPLGVRGLREIGDIDIIVMPALWAELASRYGVVENKDVKKIVFPNENIEVFSAESFGARQGYEDAPSVAERIAAAEIIDGLPFESLEHVLYFKRKMGRPKDLSDVIMIEVWLADRT